MSLKLFGGKKNSRIKLVLSVIGVTVFVFMLLSIWFYSEDPYDRIRNSEPERGRLYLSIYENTMRRSKFDTLLTRLIQENMDIKSIGIAISYIRYNKVCRFIPSIEAKCKLLRSFPEDTSWQVKIKKNRIRISRVKGPLINYSMCFCIAELRENCGNK